MRIEHNGYNISVSFIGRGKDGLNVWEQCKDDANSIEIHLGFSVEEGWGSVEGMCIPLKDLERIWHGLSSVTESEPVTCSCKLPFGQSEEEFITVTAEKCPEGIRFFLKIYDNLCDYVALTQVMSERKFSQILLELKGVLDKYPVIGESKLS